MAGFRHERTPARAGRSPGRHHRIFHADLRLSDRRRAGLPRRATEWINSPPLTAAALRGKVVLVEFGTYTCINWLRTLPYVRAWAEKYKDEGLVVIQVHAPEFEFEKDLDNVRANLKRLGIDLPIAVDNEHTIWRAFNNQYWPALYFIDGKGRIRHQHFGEGEYAESETGDSRAAGRGGKSAAAKDTVSVEGAGHRSGRRLGQPAVSGKLPRL